MRYTSETVHRPEAKTLIKGMSGWGCVGVEEIEMSMCRPDDRLCEGHAHALAPPAGRYVEVTDAACAGSWVEWVNIQPTHGDKTPFGKSAENDFAGPVKSVCSTCPVGLEAREHVESFGETFSLERFKARTGRGNGD